MPVVLITAGLPPLLADIVAEGLAAASLDVVRVESLGDAVIAGSEAFLTPPLFTIAADGRTTSLWRLRPERVELGELTPAELARAIKSER